MPTRNEKTEQAPEATPTRGRKRKNDETSPAPKRGRPRTNSNTSSIASNGSAAVDTLLQDHVYGDTTFVVCAESKDAESSVHALKSESKPDHVPQGRAEEDDDVDESYLAIAPAAGQTGPVRCPYLDTVCRPLLDFDMAKVCSVTLSDQNVYACLVCGKFFQGRGKSTPLYTHSVHFGHFVVMSLHTGRAYCLPDGYEIGAGGAPGLVADARSLSDVQRCLHPRFSNDDIAKLNTENTTLARDVHGVSYLPGFVGLNNLSHTDYVSVALHALSHVTPIRDFFLEPSNYSESKSALVHSFGEVMRKMWSSHNFKSVVSPQEFLQQVSVTSKKRFTIGCQEECIEFMVWLLNELHRGIGGNQRPGSSVIYRALQGQVQVRSLTKKKNKPAAPASPDDTAVAMDIVQDTGQNLAPAVQWEEKVQLSPFLYLSLDIPPTPLFKDSQGGLVIPQIPLFEVLKKFDGHAWTDITSSTGLVRRKYSIKKLPKYLMLHLVRFTKNNFYVEKNPSIVTFPVTNLDMKHYIDSDDESTDQIAQRRAAVADMGISELRTVVLNNIRAAVSAASGAELVVAASRDISARLQQCLDREELNGVAEDSFDLLVSTQALTTKYDLLSNICHDSLASQGTDIGSEHKSISGGPTSTENVLTQGSYRCHLQNKATGQWFELQDLHVTETMPQLIGLSESYILVYERKDVSK